MSVNTTRRGLSVAASSDCTATRTPKTTAKTFATAFTLADCRLADCTSVLKRTGVTAAVIFILITKLLGERLSTQGIETLKTEASASHGTVARVDDFKRGKCDHSLFWFD